MIQSRAVLLSRIFSNQLKKKAVTGQQPVRQGHASWNYRRGPADESHPVWVRYGAPAVGAMMWWWVLWHLWHEPAHIYGEFPEPDPRLWTDKELGIPADDYDEDVS